MGRGIVEIENRKLADIGFSAKRANRLCLVVEDVPPVFASAGLQQITRFYEGFFPLSGTGAESGIVQTVDERAVEHFGEVRAAQRVGALLRIGLR